MSWNGAGRESPLAADDGSSSLLNDAAAWSEFPTRLDTFRLWSPPDGGPAAEDLARAGFVYTGDGDRVKCPWCQKVFRDWNPGDQPYEEHRSGEPCCPFVIDNNYDSASRLVLSGM